MQERRDSPWTVKECEYGLRIRFALKYEPGEDQRALLILIHRVNNVKFNSDLPHCVRVSRRACHAD